MKIYARIVAAIVVELIDAVYDDHDNEIPIDTRFHPEIVATLVDATGVSGIAQGWTYDGTTFAVPVAPVESAADARARALIDIHDQRAPILEALAGIGFDALVAGDTTTAQAAASARTDLKNIVTLAAFLDATTYDDMKIAVMAEYKRIALAAPTTVQTAFAALLA